MSELKVFGADWCGYTRKFSAHFSTGEVRYAEAGVSVEYINCAKDDDADIVDVGSVLFEGTRSLEPFVAVFLVAGVPYDVDIVDVGSVSFEGTRVLKPLVAAVADVPMTLYIP